MSIAYLPSPSRDVWHLGVIPVRAWALCTVLGIVVAIWLTRWRYRAAGGQPRVITDVAAWAVPLGIAGARLYSVLTDYQLYFGRHADWVTLARVWDGALGLPGALVLGFAGVVIACRRAAVPLAPVLGAAAPAAAVGQAIGCWGDWFSQQLYGRPSSLPWALEIAPAHRLNGYETFATFQPVFLYQCLCGLLTAAVVIWAARRFRLTGDRAFAVYVAAFSVGMFLTQTVRADYSHHLLGLRTDEWAALVGLAGAAWYLHRTRHADPLAHLRSAPRPAGTPGKSSSSNAIARAGGDDRGRTMA